MKKILTAVAIFMITSCQKKVNCAQVKQINGMSYYQDKPFSGECISYHETGVIRSVQKYIDGLDHGKWEFFHPNSKLETKAYFDKGKRIGNWLYYFYNGELKQESYYSSAGEKNGIWIIYNKKGDTVKTINYN
tara:strand:+ start:481 stop:879 length:399 start_codon:yes stop_codon:yes gene_type:complete